MPYILAPKAAIEHIISHYINYLNDKSAQDPNTHYIDRFETIDNSYEIKNDDIADNVWDSQHQQIALKYAQDYLKYKISKHSEESPTSSIGAIGDAFIDIE